MRGGEETVVRDAPSLAEIDELDGAIYEFDVKATRYRDGRLLAIFLRKRLDPSTTEET
jgi:hypothetical protein